MIKRLLVILGVTVVVLGVVGGGCAYSIVDVARRMVNFQLTLNGSSYKTFRWCTNALPFTDKVEKLMNKKWVIVLQNNTELRPTGGFMGSFATIMTKCAADKRQCGIKDIKFSDIYEPDGKLPGHVEPPYPIQEAFGQGWWKLRDANWDPDFASSAGTISWFLEQGGEGLIDGVVGVNLSTITSILEVLGPLKMVTYDETVTAKNFYNLAQKYAETRTTGNKTDKRGFLGAVGTALVEEIKSAGLVDQIKLAKLMAGELESKQILIWAKDGALQEDMVRMRWDGGLGAGWNEVGDYVYVVDSNLGANKSDCCIERSLVQEVAKKDGLAQVSLRVIRKNNNPTEVPIPPYFWGGEYVDYVRVVVPVEANKISGVRVGGIELKQMTEEDFKIPNSLRWGRSEGQYNVELKQGFYVIGFWMTVKAGETGEASVLWESRRGAADKYELWVKRQPGIETFNYQLTVNNKIAVKEKVDKDRWYSVLLGG